jgi:chitin disaccharide deacetylase
MTRAQRALGFDASDRVVILHADDVGMCRGSVAAFEELASEGMVSSGSVMVPCPAFEEAAALCRRRPDLDVGVHLTLTSGGERFRWGPLSANGHSRGLAGDDGAFHRVPLDVCAHADPAAVYEEMRAQLDRALAEGIDVTHIDTHMFCGLYPPFLSGYVRLGCERRLPCVAWDIDAPQWSFPYDMAAEISRRVAAWAEEGALTPLDGVAAVTSRFPEQRLERLKDAFASLTPGVWHFIVHPAKDMPDLREMSPRWVSRVADFEACRNPELRAHLRNLGIHTVGYKELRDALRRVAPAVA